MNDNFLKGKAEIIVLLPHYNDNERLKNAVNSIVEPFPIDVLIIDDGSDTKPDQEELKKLYGDRGNLEVKYNAQNMKVSKIRNLGLKMILQTSYKYIAHMDSDDTNKPNRFAKQLDYLKNNKEISFIGSWGDYYTEKGEFLFTMKNPVSYKEIRKKMYLNAMFINASILYKREVIDNIKNYPDKNITVDDYHFCFLVIKKFKVANYPEPLVNINIRSQSISSSKRTKQVLERINVITENFYFGFYPIWGLFRNFLLLFMPRSFGLKMRKWFKIEGTSI